MGSIIVASVEFIAGCSADVYQLNRWQQMTVGMYQRFVIIAQRYQ